MLKNVSSIACLIFLVTFCTQNARAQFPQDFNQFTFCENIRDIFANSVNNFTNTRRPDQYSAVTIDLLEGYLTHHQEFIVNNGDTQNVQWDYRCELTTSKRRQAQDDLKLFVSRLLKCDDTVKLHVVSTTDNRDSLRADTGCPSYYSDLAVKADLVEPNTRNGGYWLHFVVYNSLKAYSYAADKEERRQHDELMAEAREKDRLAAQTHSLKIPDNARLCDGLTQLINSYHHDDWKPHWTDHITNGDANYWNTDMKMMNYQVYIDMPTASELDYTAKCTIVRDTSNEGIMTVLPIIGSQLESCTIGGNHPQPLQQDVQAGFMSWYLQVDASTIAHIGLRSFRSPHGYAYIRIAVSFPKK